MENAFHDVEAKLSPSQHGRKDQLCLNLGKVLVVITVLILQPSYFLPENL